LPADVDLLTPGFSSALYLSLVERATQSWNWWFGLLQKYVEETGTSRIESSRDFDGHRLGGWVAGQRSAQNGGQGSHLLTAERQQALEALPDWTWDPTNDRWLEMYELVKKEAISRGDSRLPTDYENMSGHKIGLWVSVQRRPITRKSHSIEQIELLMQLPKWTFTPFETGWEETFAALKAFCERTGSSRMPRGTKEDGRSIDAWCTNQRAEYRKGALSSEKIQLIESLPDWSWDPIEDDWNYCFEALSSFVKKTGGYSIPKSMKLANGVLLSSWLSNQKNRRKLGKLRADRIHQLEQLSNWTWDLFDSQWQNVFNDLKIYLEDHGEYPPRKFIGISGKQLEQWILTQRTKYKKGTLSPESVGLLESLPNWSWDPLGDQFEEAISAIRNYSMLYGDADVPHGFVTENGLKLGAWVSQKRIRYKKNKLSESQVRTLEQIPGWKWSVNEDRWAKAILAMQKFAMRESNCSVPKGHIEDGIHLANWAGQQRTNYRDGSLSTQQIQMLESLPGWSWTPKGGPKSPSQISRTKVVPNTHLTQ
jgi:hypothetical protein